MNVREYFMMEPEDQAKLRRSLTRRLEELYFLEITDDDLDQDMSFEDFLKRTINDMELVENYEGAAVVKDILRTRLWK